LDLERAIADADNPELLTIPYKLIQERITVHWPFDNCRLEGSPEEEY
jgi:hypothetical protein